MSRELIEKMARAIYREEYGGIYPGSKLHEDEHWRKCTKTARAILSLLSDPANITDEALLAFGMSFSGGRFDLETSKRILDDNPSDREALRRAIAAAFSERAP